MGVILQIQRSVGKHQSRHASLCLRATGVLALFLLLAMTVQNGWIGFSGPRATSDGAWHATTSPPSLSHAHDTALFEGNMTGLRSAVLSQVKTMRRQLLRYTRPKVWGALGCST